MSLTFGRINALRGSSVEITKITDFTKRRENRCVGNPGNGRTEYAHVWSLRRMDIDISPVSHPFSIFPFFPSFLFSYLNRGGVGGRMPPHITPPR